MSRRDCYTLSLNRRDDGTLAEVRLDVVDGDGGERSVRLIGNSVAAAAEPLRQLLAGAGVRGRTWSGTAPIELDRRSGERVELLCRAVKPLRRPDRIADVADRLAGMGAEESSYWHAKSTRTGGLRALRILLSSGGH